MDKQSSFIEQYMGEFVAPTHPVYFEWLEYYRQAELLDRCYPGYTSKHGTYIPFPNKKLSEERSFIKVPGLQGLERKQWLDLRDRALDYHEYLVKHGKL